MDIESSEERSLCSTRRSSSSVSLADCDSSYSTEVTSVATSFMRKREIIAWIVISVQALTLAFMIQQGSPHLVPSNKAFSSFSINNKMPSYHDAQFLQATSPETRSGNPFYDPPTIYPPAAGLVSRVWHSNGTPNVNDGLRTGSCWCSGDDYCMCTPALAIDLILTSGPDHIWLVRRKLDGKIALMGGFNEVGETVEEASRRELKEEMNIDLPEQPLHLFGVYSDPRRDSRKHAVSVVFHMDVPSHINPQAGDDAGEVVRMPLMSILDMDMFIDHKTVVQDFMNMRARQHQTKEGDSGIEVPSLGDEPYKRSVCDLSMQ